MKLSDLKPQEKRKKKKRVGRGISAGQGKTAGRGTKGQGARRGGGKGPYFEGGQLPLVRRLPFKRGFTNVFKINYQVVNVEDLAEHFPDGGAVAPADLEAKGLIRDQWKPIVLLGDGEINQKYDVSVHRISKSAQEKVEKAGGSVTNLAYHLQGAEATIRRPRKEIVEQRRQEAEG